jgi:hypothetical protein
MPKTGYAAFKEVGKQMKHEQVKDKEVDQIAEALGAKTESKLEVLDEKRMAELAPAIAELYKLNAMVGSEEMVGGASPLLKIYSVGKSTGELGDGTKPHDGWFFYAPTQEEFETVNCHIVRVSRSFRTPKLNDETGKPAFNQLLGGVMVNGEKYQPFIMYINGLKLRPMWDFMRDTVAPYIHNQLQPVPMFALKVKLSTKQVDTTIKTKAWIVQFDLLTENDWPVLVKDEGLFDFLLTQANLFAETMDSIIKAKTNEDTITPAEIVPPPGDENR